MGQLSLLGQGYLSFSYTKEKVKSGNTTNDGDKTTSIGLGVLPGVSYKLTDKISIEAFIGGLSFNTSTVKKPNDDKETDNSLSLSLSSNLNIGFIYKF